MWNLKKKRASEYNKTRNRLTDIENKAVGRGKGEAQHRDVGSKGTNYFI